MAGGGVFGAVAGGGVFGAVAGGHVCGAVAGGDVCGAVAGGGMCLLLRALWQLTLSRAGRAEPSRGRAEQARPSGRARDSVEQGRAEIE